MFVRQVETVTVRCSTAEAQLLVKDVFPTVEHYFEVKDIRSVPSTQLKMYLLLETHL